MEQKNAYQVVRDHYKRDVLLPYVLTQPWPNDLSLLERVHLTHRLIEYDHAGLGPHKEPSECNTLCKAATREEEKGQ